MYFYVVFFSESLQGVLLYQLEGDTSALEYFEVNNVTGAVTLIKSLEEDIYNALVYQVGKV